MQISLCKMQTLFGTGVGYPLTVSDGFSASRFEYTFSACCHAPLASNHIPSKRPGEDHYDKTTSKSTQQN